MNRIVLSLSLIVSALFLSQCASQGPRRVCDDLEIDLPAHFTPFTESEKKLLCGDPKNSDWKEIPRTQMLYLLRVFLNERGYFDARIKDAADRVQVEPGPRFVLNTLYIEGWPDEIAPFPTHHFRGRILRPRLLDELEKEMLLALRAQGYPCPKVSTHADAKKQRLVARVQPGPRRDFSALRADPIEEIDATALRRFDAFIAPQTYDYRLLEMSEERARRSGFVQDQNLLARCEGDFHILQKTIPGKTRFFSIGAGFDTEQLLIARARLNLGRLNRRGSNLMTEALASFRLQSIRNVARFYAWTAVRRDYLYLKLDGEHRIESQSRSFSTTLGFGYGRDFESEASSWQMRLGPQFTYSRIFRGPGPSEGRGVAIEASLGNLSHDYEYYASRPQKGYAWNIQITHHPEIFGAAFSASRLKGNLTWHKKIIDAARFDVIASFRAESQNTVGWGAMGGDKIPLTERSFLGGSQDLRGFGRAELPLNGRGALSATYGGVEMRVARLFSLEPLLFVDAGALGDHAFEARGPYYLSPGMGLRWGSAFGTLRFTAAYGYSLGSPEREENKSHVQYFASFGEEF